MWLNHRRLMSGKKSIKRNYIMNVIFKEYESDRKS